MLKAHDTQNLNRPLLVDQLQADIRRRGLRPGDRYLTADEAAQTFGVSSATVHRAMAILAEKDMLVRKRNRGTFVGPAMENHSPAKLRTVYLLLPTGTYGVPDYPLGSMVCGVRQAMGDVNVQYSFLPANNSLAYVRELIRSAQSVGEVGGFVAVSCPRDVYALLADSGVPAVILGTPYPDQGQKIPSVDVDNHEAGRLLMQQLVQCGHQRFLLITGATDRPGDNHFFDGVSEELTAARLPHNALIVRVVPPETEALPSIVREIMDVPEHPTAVIARGSSQLGQAVETAVADVASSLSQPFETIFLISPFATEWGKAHTYITAEKNAGEFFELVGQMLERIGQGIALEQERVVIPVKIGLVVRDVV